MYYKNTRGIFRWYMYVRVLYRCNFMKDIKIIKLFWSVTVSRYPKIQFPIVIYYKIKRLKKKKYPEKCTDSI